MDIPASIPEPGDVFDESPTSSIPAPTPEVGDVLDGSVAEISESEPDRSTFDPTYVPTMRVILAQISRRKVGRRVKTEVFTPAQHSFIYRSKF